MFRRVTGFVLMLFAFLLISVSLLPWFSATTYAAGLKVFADSSGIRIVSGEPVFDLDNFAPGDSATTNLEVVNESSEIFSLAISAEIEEGAGPLKEKLWIAIDGVYDGPLGSLERIDLGSFPAGARKSFPIEILLPRDTGNECQGLAVTIRFRIGQLSGGGPPGADPEEPVLPVEREDPSGPADDNLAGSGDELGKLDPVLPVTGTNSDLLLPLGLALFLIGLLLFSSADKKQAE